MDAEVRQSLFDDAIRGFPHTAIRIVLVHKLHGCFGECSDVRNAAHLFTDCSLFSIFYSREEGTLGVEERSLFQPTYLSNGAPTRTYEIHLRKPLQENNLQEMKKVQKRLFLKK